MKVLRNFNDFVKRNKINEDRFEEGDEKEFDEFDGFDDDMDDEEFDEEDFDDLDDDDMDDMDDDELYDDDDNMEDMDDDEDFDGDDDMEDMEDMEDMDGLEGEEEEGEYKGTLMMRELADLLETEVSDTNEIEYNGHKINFYSETEKFHVGKKTFETPQEVLEYVQSTDVSEDSVKNERYSPKNRRRR